MNNEKENQNENENEKSRIAEWRMNRNRINFVVDCDGDGHESGGRMNENKWYGHTW